jgi:hypothetical protein
MQTESVLSCQKTKLLRSRKLPAATHVFLTLRCLQVAENKRQTDKTDCTDYGFVRLRQCVLSD